MSENFLGEIGVHIGDVVAGFIGGVARILMPPFMGAWSSLSTVLLGAITAAYMTDPVMAVIGEKMSRGTVGFIVGLAAMMILQGAIGAVSNIKFPGGRKDA